MVTVDVIVVGAGIVGCVAAESLARGGARVRVIDARRVCGGASQASAGILAPYTEGHEPGVLRSLGRRSLDLYDDFIGQIADASGRSIFYDRSGTLEIALDAEQAERHRLFGASVCSDVDAEWLDAEALQAIEPLVASGAYGALFIRTHGFVAVPDLTEALAEAARRHGAEFSLSTQVTAIAPMAGGGVQVDTDGGPLNADQVVLAAGSWGSQINMSGVEPIPVKPVRGQLLHLTWPAQYLRHVVWGADCYIVPWPTGRVLVGATVEDAGFDERATVAGVRDLLEAACTLVPQMWQASFTEVRVGLRPGSPDGLPLIGRSQVIPGLVFAMGHYRNGVLLAPLTGLLLSNLVLGVGDDPALQELAPARLGEL